MILDAQHDRSALQPAAVLDETHTEPHTEAYATRPGSGQTARPIPARAEAIPPAGTEAPAETSAEISAEAVPTNTFEAFGSFSG